MSLDREVYRKRLESLRARLEVLGADGLFATPSSNLFYLTGIAFDRSERLTALVLFKDRDPLVICPAFEGDRLRAMSAVTEVHTWEETEDPFRLCASFFPAGRGVLAVEPSTAVVGGRPEARSVRRISADRRRSKAARLGAPHLGEPSGVGVL